jgi:hypothetical protein
MTDMALFAEDEPDRQQTLDEASSQEAGLVMLPSFQGGGRVEKTGPAYLHEGEYVVPAERASAGSDVTGMHDKQVINYYFPVEVEVIGSLSYADIQSIARHIYDELDAALRNQQSLLS